MKKKKKRNASRATRTRAERKAEERNRQELERKRKESEQELLSENVPLNKIEIVPEKYMPAIQSANSRHPIVIDDPRYSAHHADAKKKQNRTRRDRSRLVKASGVKSVFRVGNTLFTTAFGPGNQAILEKHLPQNRAPVDLNTNAPTYNLRLKKNEHSPESPFEHSSQSDNMPMRKDLIEAKTELEERYFGQTFDDNIHIQLIYCIRDIEKTLATHINEIIYTINNLHPVMDAGKEDFLGDKLQIAHPYDKIHFAETQRFAENDGQHARYQANAIRFRDWFDALSMDARLGYFGPSIYPETHTKKVISDWRTVSKKMQQEGYLPSDKDKEVEETFLGYQKRLYYYLLLLSMSRQSLAHSNERNRDVLYRFCAYGDGCADANTTPMPSWKEASQILNELYAEKVNKLNEDFLTNAKVNLTIIQSFKPSSNKEQLIKQVQDFYDFEVRKDGKNLGFSLTRLRECALAQTDNYANAVRDQIELAVRNPNDGRCPNRHKFNKIFDFILFEHYKSSPEEAEDLIQRLRSAANNAAKKQKIYRDEAFRLWGLYGKDIAQNLVPKVTGANIGKLNKPGANIIQIDESMLDGIRIEPTAHTFSKLVYLMTLFLDGKEINILLTTLIHQFENIGSFLQAIKDANQCGIPVDTPDFCAPYSMFADSCYFNADQAGYTKTSGIARELRTINSFARMTGPNNDILVKEKMFLDAAELLGYEADEESLKNYIHALLGKSEDGTPSPGNNPFRNFIANNAISSSRFLYIIRYGKPKNLRQLASNQTVVSFVLKDMPDDQIIRYYKACGLTALVIPQKDAESQTYNASDLKTIEKMRVVLAKKITQMSFLSFEHVPQNAKNSGEKSEKEQMQALVQLYLSVLYQLIKNLVYINSRYFMAFHCLEQDAYLLSTDKNPLDSLFNLTRQALDTGRIKNAGARVYLDQNIKNTDDKVIKAFRNNVMHLNAVSDAHAAISKIKRIESYFALYHFSRQRKLIDKFSGQSTKNQIPRYFELVKQHGTYCKDFVKALNVPFGYNLPRYKNLSIDELFDRNRPRDTVNTVVSATKS